MKLTLRGFILTVLSSGISFFSFSQKKISTPALKADLDLVKKTLIKHHLGFGYYEDTITFNSNIEKILQNYPDSISQRQAYIEITELIASIEDLHTSTRAPKNFSSKKPITLPLILRKFDQYFFVHYNISTDSTILRTAEISKIENMPVWDLYQDFRKMYGTDNNNPVSKDYYAERAFSRYLYAQYGQTDSTLITFKNPKDSVFRSIYVKNITSKESLKILKSRYKNATRQNLGYQVVDSTRHIAKLDITSFMEKKGKFDFNQRGFKIKLKSAFKKAESQKIEHLIVDLRANGGGYIPNVGRLTSYVAKEPYALTDSMIFKPKSYFKIFTPLTIFGPVVGRIMFKKQKNGNYFFTKKKYKKPASKHHFDGKLYVIMDGGSYSATTFTIGLWRDMNLATFVGSQPGGANWGSFAGTWKLVKLPNTKSYVRVPLFKIVHNQPNKTTQSFFVQPDFEVDQSFSDFENRKDTQLEFILNLIKKSKLQKD